MPVKNEPRYAGEFMVSEGNGQYSRDIVTILSGFKANAGDVLGRILVAAAVAAAVAGNTGNGTSSAVVVGAGAKAGVYRLNAVAATKFVVTDPAGINLGVATTGVAFTAGGITLTLTAGGTPFAAGDAFTVTVAAGSMKYVPIDATGTDGRQTAAAIAYSTIDATAADVNGPAIVRHCEVNGAEIGWGALNGGQITQGIADLSARGIFVRNGSV